MRFQALLTKADAKRFKINSEARVPTVFFLISSGYLSVAAARFSGRNSRVCCPHYVFRVFSHPSNGAQTQMSVDVGPQPGGQPLSGADAPCRPLCSRVRRPRGGEVPAVLHSAQAGKPLQQSTVSWGPWTVSALRLSLPRGHVPRRCVDLKFARHTGDLASSSPRCGWRGRLGKGACGFPFFDLSWGRITVNQEQTRSQLGQELVPPSLASASVSLSPCRAPLSPPPTRYRKPRPWTTLPFVSIKSPRGFKGFKKLQCHVLVP